MASISKEPNGRKTIQFVDGRRRRSIRLGKVSDKVAVTIRGKVEALLAAKSAGHHIDQATADWLGQIPGELHQRLAKAGLAESRSSTVSATLTGFIENYMASRTGLKPNTIRNYLTSKRLLGEHFGKARLIGTIHAGHARDYREWLAKSYAPAMVSREIKRARQFFGYALDCQLIASNPFEGIKAGTQKNSSRKHFVERATIDQVLQACPDTEWRVIVALARYGGLRIPSELANLTWADVDWEQLKIRLKVPKKEHLDGQGQRLVPIFPEIRPHLEQAFEEALEGSTWVAPRARLGSGNLRTGLLRILDHAQIAAWPKIFQNLRATRETELMREFPAHVVYAWLGNSREVAQDHYLMVTDEDYARAAGSALQNPVQSGAARGPQEPPGQKETAVPPAFADCTAVLIPPRGVEPRFSD